MALFLLASVVSCSVVYLDARQRTAATGQVFTSDSMGLLWPLVVPFVYVAFVAIFTLSRLVATTILRFARRPPPSNG